MGVKFNRFYNYAVDEASPVQMTETCDLCGNEIARSFIRPGLTVEPLNMSTKRSMCCDSPLRFAFQSASMLGDE